MPYQESEQAARRLAVLCLSGIIAIAGSVFVFGWLAGLEPLVRLRPTWHAMVPSTALSFCIAAGGLLYCLVRGDNRVSALTGLVIGVVPSMELEDILLPAALRPSDAVALATLIGFLLAAFCLIALSFIEPRGPTKVRSGTFFTALSTLGLVWSAFPLVGYLLAAEELAQSFIFTSMSAQSAICFLLLFLALLCSRPHGGWLKIVLGRGRGSAMARRMLPAVVLLPLGAGLLASWATRAGLISADFRLALLSLTIVILLAALLLYHAHVENMEQWKARRAGGTEGSPPRKDQ